MKRRVSFSALIVTVLFAIAVAFSATFFPMRYVAAREAERYAEEKRGYEAAIKEYQSSIIPEDDRYDAEHIRHVLDYLVRNSIFPLPTADVLTEAMIESILDAMGDRHGTYYNPTEYEEHKNDVAGSLYGVGVTVTESEQGYIEILHIHAGSPIDGIGMAGDLIVAVNGAEVSELGYEAALAALKGDAGSKVALTVLRGGERVSLGEIPRGAYTKQTVVAKTVEAGGKLLGYVHLTGFDRQTFEQFSVEVARLESAGIDGMIFDLRNNPGGLLWEVAEVLAYVLPDGDIVHVDYASDRFSDYTITAKDGYVSSENVKPSLYAEGGHALSVPIAILVNAHTASAAELFTAAIRDYAAEGKLEATVIGVTTYGKGTVQTTDTAAAGEVGAALKLSVAHYNPPCNESYDGIGIEPDLRVELPPELSELSIFKLTLENDAQLRAAIALLAGGN